MHVIGSTRHVIARLVAAASPFVVCVCDLGDLVPAISPEHAIIEGHQGAVCNIPRLVILGPANGAVRLVGRPPAGVICAVVTLLAAAVGSTHMLSAALVPQPSSPCPTPPALSYRIEGQHSSCCPEC